LSVSTASAAQLAAKSGSRISRCAPPAAVRASLMQRHLAGGVRHLVDVVRADLRAVDLHRALEGVGLDVLARDDEERVADRQTVARRELVALRLADDAADGLRRLVDVEDLALAHARRGDLRVAGDLEPSAGLRLADGEDGTGGADFKRGVDVGH